MTITELQIQLDFNPDNRASTLKNVNTCRYIDIGYLFVDSEDGQCYLFDKNGNLDDIHKVKCIDILTFDCCTSLTSIKIPDSVKSIGDWAFYGCKSLTSISIPDTVKSIGDYAFYDCISLTSISIPNSVERIGNYAFDSCTALTSISIPDSVKSIGNSAFAYCNPLKEVIFKGKTIGQVKAMDEYPWGIENESVIKVENKIQT